MSDRTSARDVKDTGAEYLGWRGELLAQLALSRVTSLTVYQSPVDQDHDFLVSTREGTCFFVDVKAFSSAALRIRDIDRVEELRWRVDVDVLQRAQRSRSPVVLFLFDADTDHGRFLRLDTIPVSKPAARLQTIRFPITNVIGKETLESLASELER